MRSEDLYRRLLRAYPRAYRHRYAEVMAECFRDQMRAANGTGKRIVLWCRVMLDLILSVPVRHLEHLHFLRNPYTSDARRAVFYARNEATAGSQVNIALEHLLVGALRSDGKLAFDLLGPRGLGALARAIQPKVQQEAQPGASSAQPLPLSRECKLALERALDEARGSDAAITPRDIVKAILRQDTSLAARLLRERGDVSRL